jgi:hypothetical protein
MVSQKVVVVLITLAILLSVASIVVTISSVNTKLVPPEVKVIQKAIPSSESAKVGIVIQNPTGNP